MTEYTVGTVIDSREHDEPPDGTVIVDTEGNPFQRYDKTWYNAWDGPDEWKYIAAYFPVTIVWMPK